VFKRVVRWASATDPRIVRRLWPRQSTGAQHALCPSCGGTMPDGMLVTLNRMGSYCLVGPAYQALASGDLEALTTDLPIEPGELWCVVCLPCLEAGAPTRNSGGLSEQLLALVDEAIQSD
jgi:hypothetical protein